jgi:uncharacterized protein YoxC
MALLLTILSVLALWALLGVLVAGLLLILRPLQSVRGYLEKITMGVRAIEKQTAPLGARAGTLRDSLDEASTVIQTAARRFADMDRDLDAAMPALRPR